MRAGLLVSGREDALEVIDQAMVDLAAGRGGVVVLEGPAGSGRTALLTAVGASAAAANIPLVEAGVDHPLSLYRLAQLRRDAEATDESRPHPAVVVTVDDIDMCDSATRSAGELAPPLLGDTALLWVVAGTPGAVAPERHPDRRRVRLGELSVQAAEMLVRQCTGRDEVDDVVRGALDTVPLFPRHIVETARRSVGSATSVGWPRCLLTGLGADSRRILTAGAALGTRFSLEDLGAVLDRPVASLVEPLLAAIGSGVLRSRGDDLTFSHRLVRDLFATGPGDALVAQALTTFVRTNDADRLVAALRDQGIPDLAPDDLRDLSKTAASRDLRLAAALARQEAAERAADTGLDDEPGRQDAAARAISYAVQAGDPDAARTAAAALSTEHPPMVGFALAEVFLASDSVAALAVAERAEHLATTDLERARLAAIRLACHAYVDACRPGEVQQAAQLAERSGDARACALVGLAQALDASAAGDLVEALRHAALASEVPDGDSHGPEWWIAGIFRAKLLSDLGRLDEATQLLDSMARLAERRSQIGAIPNLLMVRATCETEAGNLRSAATMLRAARHLARAIGRPALVETNAVNFLVRIAHLRGDTHSLADLRPILEERLTGDAGRSTTAAIGLLFAVDITSDAEVAEWARLSEKLDGPRRYAIARGLTDEIPRLRILLRHGLRQHAAQLCRLLTTLAAASDAALPRVAARHAEAVMRGDVETLRDARNGYRDLSRPMLAAQASEDLADACTEREERAAALREARALWLACGAHRETARIDKRLRSAGLRPPRAAKPQLGLGLTVSEERVVREVVAGRTNSATAEALFLSPRTVAVHLRRIYAKTGVRNRAELIDLIRKRSADAG
jgi:DNA-binding CsgD family transcriptional regulator